MKGRLVAASLQQRTLSKPGLSNSWSLQACNREGRAEEMKGSCNVYRVCLAKVAGGW
ncbi:hypothetical protein HanRHA438_Chr17g0790701 [Helianthus annuus]|uniref:Uncharacterized protein n=1 Tax=Helianthus annuus TaxID=4232 RepID=A0A251RKY9_HELAN|nr:hypothetical protein HanXRQr2_Chr17g0780151 [Helianthus annuus]KAJ0427519.1 hypothetical protein HanHA300_Chr17g0636141 [Helianthus annuus]KAJ0445802.1 hypothetical protein HanHA89_Chr17g0687431 [Helianthus annuus]KAJ0630768.1 hypothetical protein HanLR1_Chr17g0646841 [Helianthus annuus]KAJ0824273.1 hypothetical protein HanRHA438_Chr17g0790701 [Helianthus annuus]